QDGPGQERLHQGALAPADEAEDDGVGAGQDLLVVEGPGVVGEPRAEEVPPHIQRRGGEAPFGHEGVGGAEVGGGDPMGQRRAAHQAATPARRSWARAFFMARRSDGLWWTRTWVVRSGERSMIPLRVGTARQPAPVAAAMRRRRA